MADIPETLDSLAVKVVALTTAIDTRFDSVDKRFDSVDRRFDSVDKRFDSIDRRFEGVDQRFQGIDQRFQGIDRRFQGIDRHFDELKAELRTQIEAVDAKVGLVLEKVTDLIARDARHSAVHIRHEQVLDNHDLRLMALESDKKATGQ